MAYCWKSWRWDGKHGKMFCKSRKKKKIDLLQLGLCCVVAVWEWWHRWEVVIPLPSSSSLMQLCLLFVFAQKIFGFLQILRRVFPIFFFQPLPELINIMFFEFLQLSLEAHVWIGTGPRRADNRQRIFPAKVCDGHDVGNHQCDTPGDTCKAVN